MCVPACHSSLPATAAHSPAQRSRWPWRKWARRACCQRTTGSSSHGPRRGCSAAQCPPRPTRTAPRPPVWGASAPAGQCPHGRGCTGSRWCRWPRSCAPRSPCPQRQRTGASRPAAEAPAAPCQTQRQAAGAACCPGPGARLRQRRQRVGWTRGKCRSQVRCMSSGHAQVPAGANSLLAASSGDWQAAVRVPASQAIHSRPATPPAIHTHLRPPGWRPDTP
jgi:hypothetical protein